MNLLQADSEIDALNTVLGRGTYNYKVTDSVSKITYYFATNDACTDGQQFTTTGDYVASNDSTRVRYQAPITLKPYVPGSDYPNSSSDYWAALHKYVSPNIEFEAIEGTALESYNDAETHVIDGDTLNQLIGVVDFKQTGKVRNTRQENFAVGIRSDVAAYYGNTLYFNRAITNATDFAIWWISNNAGKYVFGLGNVYNT